MVRGLMTRPGRRAARRNRHRLQVARQARVPAARLGDDAQRVADDWGRAAQGTCARPIEVGDRVVAALLVPVRASAPPGSVAPKRASPSDSTQARPSSRASPAGTAARSIDAPGLARRNQLEASR